eukprot:scaffold137901_cov17-Prasinocladus_malaysianus.AAC.1
MEQFTLKDSPRYLRVEILDSIFGSFLYACLPEIAGVQPTILHRLWLMCHPVRQSCIFALIRLSWLFEMHGEEAVGCPYYSAPIVRFVAFFAAFSTGAGY